MASKADTALKAGITSILHQNPEFETFESPKPQTSNPKPYSLNPIPYFPIPQTLNPKPIPLYPIPHAQPLPPTPTSPTPQLRSVFPILLQLLDKI